MPQHVFMSWPEEDDPRWRDTGEDGMFGYLVYRAISQMDHIPIDVNAHLHTPHLPLPDALGGQLWAAPVVGGPVDQPQSVIPWSQPLRAALYLGSCPRSLVNVDTGEPFRIERTTLTWTGDAIMHTMNYEYGFGGDLLTFSGRPCRRRWKWPQPQQITDPGESTHPDLHP